MRDKTKKATVLDHIGDYIWDHPVRVVTFILFLYILIFAVMAGMIGCAHQPPRHFENGDRTVFGPPNWGEVIEPGMAKPEEEPPL